MMISRAALAALPFALVCGCVERPGAAGVVATTSASGSAAHQTQPLAAPAPAAPAVPGAASATPAADGGAPASPQARARAVLLDDAKSVGTAERCLERELAQRGLNAYGDKRGTQYMGGTPLFDERTGTRRSRLEYLRERHPDLAARCGGADAGASAE